MNSSPLVPRLLKGALVAFNLPDPRPLVIPFQYNPETLTRSLEVQVAGGEGDSAGGVRYKGAPVETIKLDIELDATDALEEGKKEAEEMGIYPQLSALEMLLYPSTGLVLANTALMALGTIELLPPAGPFILFIWGPRRVLPISLKEFSITEESHDTNLNPIRAKVSLGMRVISYNDLSVGHVGHHIFLAHQVLKEALARDGLLNDLSAISRGDLKLI